MRQHYIPCVHLKRFTDINTKNHVWTYDSQTNECRHGTPENTAVESHFYSIENPDGTKNIKLEKLLAEIEGKAAPIYDELLNKNVVVDFGKRDNFSLFLAMMYFRTPTMRRVVAEFIAKNMQISNYILAKDDKAFDNQINEFEKQYGPIDSETKEACRANFINPSNTKFVINKEATLFILESSYRLAPLFTKMKWSLVSPTEEYFITSDNPLIKSVDPRSFHPIYGDGGFANNTLEVSFPLSPELLLVMSHDTNASNLKLYPLEQVYKINQALAANSERYLFAHKYDPQIKDLAKKYKDSKTTTIVDGFGPDKFAETKVKRSKK
jgi:hypothetical protein